MNGPRVARVVLADDDAALRGLLAGVLRREGYLVEECVDGRSLFMRIEAGAMRELEQVDVVITDVRMPRFTGDEIVATWAETRPDVRLVLMTAFPDDALRARARSLHVPLLEKPFGLDVFRRVVRQTVERVAIPMVGAR